MTRYLTSGLLMRMTIKLSIYIYHEMMQMTEEDTKCAIRNGIDKRAQSSYCLCFLTH